MAICPRRRKNNRPRGLLAYGCITREAGLVDALIKLLKTSSDDAVQSAAAGGLYNLVTKQDREKLEQNNVVEIMRQLPISRNIHIRLGIAAVS